MSKTRKTRDVDYKKELESAAKSMILVHEPDTLIKMIVRTIVQKVQVTHASILLQHKDRDTFILSVSRGPTGLKVPAGFVRMDKDSPLIRFFSNPEDDGSLRKDVFIYDNARQHLKKNIRSGLKTLLRQVLRQMQMFESVLCIPSYFRQDLLGMLLLGAKKDGKKYSRNELDFFLALASDVAMAMRNAQLFQDLQAELDRKNRLFMNTTVALAAAIEAKDHYTRGHTSRVTSVSMELAKKMSLAHHKLMNQKFFDDLQIASLLHDIGKIGVPENILNKTGPLDEQERKRIQEHPMTGVTIIQSIKELENSIQGVKHHHERYDGTGYPDRLKGTHIPLMAAIIAVADAFDAITTDRPYRRGLSKDEAVGEIIRGSGTQFDPRVTQALVELCKEGKL